MDAHPTAPTEMFIKNLMDASYHTCGVISLSLLFWTQREAKETDIWSFLFGSIKQGSSSSTVLYVFQLEKNAQGIYEVRIAIIDSRTPAFLFKNLLALDFDASNMWGYLR